MIPLLSVVFLCWLCASLFVLFRGQIQDFAQSLVFSLGSLNYNPGGLVVPVGYHVPVTPYLPPAANVSASWWTFLSGVSASYNGLNINLRRNEADGSFTSLQFQYYNTGGGPALPIIGINVTGLAAAIDIRNATRAALVTAGFVVPNGTPTTSMRVQQPFPGTQGAVGFVGDFNGLGLIAWTVNGYQAPIDPLSIYGNTLFFGFEVSAPAIIGRTRGMLPVAAGIFNGG
jgi:hypothetical protein